MKKLSYLLFFINAYLLILIIWSCTKGFDISDESYYYLGYKFLNTVPDNSGEAFHLIYDRFFSFLQLNLFGVRILRLVLSIGSTIILYTSLLKILKNLSFSNKTILLNLLISGILLSYTIGPQAISYNSISTILITLIVSSWIYFTTNQNKVYKFLNVFIIGFLFTILFFVKITNIILLPILIIITYIGRKHSIYKPQINVYILIFFLLGIFNSLIIISESILNIPEIINHHISTLKDISNDNYHSIENLANVYYSNIINTFKRAIYPLVLISLGFLSIRYLLKKDVKIFSINTFNIIALVIVLISVISNNYYLGGEKYAHQLIVVYLLLVFIIFLNLFHFRLLKKEIIFYLLLIGIPLSGVLGTDNNISSQVLLYGNFVFLILFLLMNNLNVRLKNIFVILIIGISTIQVSTTTIINPYRQSPLTNSIKNNVNNHSLKYLRLDDNLFKIQKKLTTIINTKYLFTYSHYRGISLLLDKIPTSLTWYNYKWNATICNSVNKTKIESSQISFIIPKDEPLNKELIKCLKVNNFDLQKDFLLNDSLRFFDRTKNKETTLLIYTPNK